MNDKQTNQLTMFEEVNDTLDANADIVIKVKPAQDGHAFLKTQIVEIHTQHEIQQKITTGITDDKEQTRSEYEESILKVGGGLMAHAAATDNKELYAMTDISGYKLIRMREEKLYDYGKTIYDLALPLQPQLAELMISSEDVALLNTKREAFGLLMPKKRTAIGVASAATDHLDELIRETNIFLYKKLDKIMFLFRTTYPDFYKQYRSARMIIDRGHGKKGKTQISGKVSDFETEKPLAGVKVYLNDEATTTAITDAAGSYLLGIAAAGTYTIKAELAGYDTYNEEFEIENLENIELDIEMEKSE